MTALETPNKPSVSFYPYAEVCDTLHKSDYSDAETSACWYTNEELYSIRETNKATIRNMEKNVILMQEENNELCIRGLEMRTRQHRIRRKTLLETVRTVVFHEQAYQWQRQIFDPEAVATICCEATQQATILARLMGVSDEEQIFLEEQQKQHLPSTDKMESCCVSTGGCLFVGLATQNRRRRPNQQVNPAA